MPMTMVRRNCLLSLVLCLWVGIDDRSVFAAEEPVSSATIVNRLKSNKEPTRRSAIPLVEWDQGHDAEYLVALDEIVSAAVRRPVLDSAFGALFKLADCPLPEASKSVAQVLEATDWRLVMTAVEVLGRRESDEFAPEIGKVWDRPEARQYYALRHAVVCTIGDIGGPQSVDTLVGLLPKLDGQLKYEAVARLTLRTGENHGADVAAWKEWWTAQNGVVPDVSAAADEPLPVDLPWQRVLPRFFNVPIYSQRVVFVLDHSKSMLSTLEGKTRLEALQEQFQQVIQRLPETTSFGLIVFNDRVDVWQSKLVPASTANKNSAIQSIYSLQSTGRTAVFDSLEKGLRLDQNVEQIIFLTDGRPTAGKYTKNEDIITAISQMNRYLHTRIDCLGIDTEGPPEDLLKEISRQTYGTYTRIR